MTAFTFRLKQEKVPETLRRNLGKMGVEKLKANADLLDYVADNENIDVEVAWQGIKGNYHELQDVYFYSLGSSRGVDQIGKVNKTETKAENTQCIETTR